MFIVQWGFAMIFACEYIVIRLTPLDYSSLPFPYNLLVNSFQYVSLMIMLYGRVYYNY
jgi:hypothetical protein